MREFVILLACTFLVTTSDSIPTVCLQTTGAYFQYNKKHNNFKLQSDHQVFSNTQQSECKSFYLSAMIQDMFEG